MMRYNLPPQGLGTLITQLSFLLAVKEPVTALVTETDNLIFDLVRVFKIDDQQVRIELGTDGVPFLGTDEICTYVPYVMPATINLYGKDFSTEPKKKPCVALSMHHGSGLGENVHPKSMPFNKYSTAEEYNQIFDHLTRMGYDVITINSTKVNVEQKAYLLNELCDFVIGYEGGLHHLAHCLNVPSIILPWKYNDMGGDPVYPSMYFETHRYHASRKSHFLNTVNEFLELDQEQLAQLIDRLHNGQGNNILFDPGTYMVPETLQIFNGHMNLTPRIMWCETFGQYTTNFIRENLPFERMVKYPLKSKT